MKIVSRPLMLPTSAILFMCVLAVGAGAVTPVQGTRGFESPPQAPLAQVGACSCGEQDGPAEVYLHSGEYHHRVVDLWIPGRGIDFRWARKYRSQLGRMTEQGHSWDFSYNLSIRRVGQDVLVFDGNGRTDLFERQQGTSVGGPLYLAPELFREGRFESDGCFSLMFPDQSRWVFRSLSDDTAPGMIHHIADRNGNTLMFSYDALGRLSMVTDTLGRDILVSYNADGFISAVTDFAGRRVRYEYYPAGVADGEYGDLRSATSPAVTGTPNGNDFPAGKTTTYRYSKGFSNEELNHNLRSITDPRGQTYLLNTYAPTTDPQDHEFDRLIQQVRGNATDILNFHYEAIPAGGLFGPAAILPCVIVNDRVGNVSEFSFDSMNRCVLKRRYTGRANPGLPTTPTSNRPQNPLRPSDPVSFDTHHDYNEDARRIRTVHPNGNVTEWVHEFDLNPGAGRRTRGNLRELRRLPGSHLPAGDQPELVQLFEWEPGFGACCGKAFVTKSTDPRGKTSCRFYDIHGNRLREVHRIRSIVEDFEYNSFGQLTAHVLPDNGSSWRRRDEFTYYSQADGPAYGYLKDSVVDAQNLRLTTTREYDPVGNVIRRIDPRGNDRLFAVNQLNQVVRETSVPITPWGAAPFRFEKDYFFDANNNLVREDVQNVDAMGAIQANSHLTTTFDHDLLNNVVRKTQEINAAESAVTEYRFDGNRNRVEEIFGEATNGSQPDNRVAMLFDERDLLFRRTRAPGTAIQSTDQFDYDGNRNLVRRRAGLEGEVRRWRTTFDGYNRPVVVRDSMGNQVETHYDPNGNVVSVLTLGELCDLPGATDNVRLVEVAYSYDAMDRLVQEDRAHFDSTTQQPVGDGLSITDITYSDHSQELSRRDDNSNLTRRFFDTACRLASVVDAKDNAISFGYDPNSNLVQVTEFEQSDTGQTPETFITRHSFDERDRRVATTDNVGNTWRQAHDSRDNVTHRTDSLGNRVEVSFDGLNRRMATTRFLTDDGTGTGNPAGEIVTTEEWDHSSRLVVQGDGHSNFTRHSYDPLGRRTLTTNADDTTESQGYNVHDDVVTAQVAEGSIIVAGFDRLGREIRRDITPGAGTSSDTTFEAFKFDGLSRLVEATDDDSMVLWWHDSLSNRVQETQNGRTLTTQCDGEGNRLSQTYPGGRTITREFDELNRVASISDSDAIATYEYFGPRRVERRTYPKISVQSLTGYDGARRIVSTSHINKDPIDERRYSWDAMYNKIRREDVRSGGPGVIQDFSYDSAYRLIRSTVQDASGLVVGDIQYRLDEVGNRELVNGDPDCSGDYFMDPVTPEPADHQANQYSLTPCDSRTYGLGGNLAQVAVEGGGGHTMTYDYRRRMVVYSNDFLGHYTYDALGRRTSQTITDPTGGSHTTLYFYDDWQVCEERDDTDGVLATHAYGIGIDEILNRRTTDQDYYYCSDDLGSIVAVKEAEAGVVERYQYADYGKPSFFAADGTALSGSAIGNPFLFTGRRYCPETQLYYFRTRYLDPATGRFTTRDPIGIWGDSNNIGNGSAYVGNNPQSLVDPYGLVFVSSVEDPNRSPGKGLSELDRKRIMLGAVAGIEFALGVVWAALYISSNPDPDGSPSGVAPDFDLAIWRLKQAGGIINQYPNIYSTPLGNSLEDHRGTIDPWVNPHGRDWEGGGMGGGLGLNGGGFKEDIERKKRQGRGRSKKGEDDDDGDGNGKPPPGHRFGHSSIGPEDLVNPVPEDEWAMLGSRHGGSRGIIVVGGIPSPGEPGGTGGGSSRFVLTGLRHGARR